MKVRTIKILYVQAKKGLGKAQNFTGDAPASLGKCYDITKPIMV